MDVKELEAIIFDFDGVLTDNAVYVDQDGVETVRCSRADGLAFAALRTLPLRIFLLSTETNPVVRARAAKLQVSVVHSSIDKEADITALAQREGFTLAHTLYIGNDLNDLRAMRRCGMSACPADAHERVRAEATIRLRTPGGHGVAREVVEEVLRVDLLEVLR